MRSKKKPEICFTCQHWRGTRRKKPAYCYRLHLDGNDAPTGDMSCVLWECRKK